MGDNVAQGIIIAVTVVLVASLVATVLTLMAIGQSILGSGQNKLQSGLSLIEQQDLMQFANATKKGSVIKSVLNLYQGDRLAILVKTTALHKQDTAYSGTNPVSGKGLYFNYNSLLTGYNKDKTFGGDTKKYVVLDAGAGSSTSALRVIAGQSNLESELMIVNGIPHTNYDTSGIATSGTLEGILDNGLFFCQLTQDVTGAIIGIVFTQQK